MNADVAQDRSNVQTCVNCKAQFGPDVLYCTNCGYILPQALSKTNRTQLIGAQQNQAANLQWGTGYFHQRARLFLRVEQNDSAIHVPLYGASVILGRDATSETAYVDLASFGARELGVSRRHIRIDRTQDVLRVTDLESANGTYLNRTKLIAGVPHTLRNRAVLQLGQMVMRVQFA
jgi:pSer/pThr/pTyr-binding forkhead associated (FHA) protein